MPAYVLPNIGLLYGWERGEDFWGGPLNDDLVTIDSITHLTISRFAVSAPPTDTFDGEIIRVGTNPVGEWAGQSGSLALRLGGAWRFYTPRYGWRARVRDLNAFMWFDGTNWLDEATGFDPENPVPPSDAPRFYEVAVSVTEAQANGAALLYLPITSNMVLPAAFNGSAMDIGDATPVDVRIDILRNDSTVGYVVAPAGAYNGQFYAVGTSGTTFLAGDRLVLRLPQVGAESLTLFGLILKFTLV